MSTDLRLRRIEAILSEIEQLDRESGGAFRQIEDREAHDVAARIQRTMARQSVKETGL